MEPYKIKIIESVVVTLIFFITKLITKTLIQKVGKKFKYQENRIKITNKIVSFLLLILFLIFIVLIWEVERSELILFISSILTILGVAFFAQWSIMSNITSTLIIFFNHPIKMGDALTIMEKDYEISGQLIDIGIFFIVIKTDDDKEITMPSNIFLQKMIKKERS